MGMGNSQQSKTNLSEQQQKKQEKKSTEPDPKLYEWSKDDDVPQNLDFDIWYPLIKDYTMKSTLIECSKQEVEAITILCDENRPGVLKSQHFSSKLTETHQKTLKQLQSNIDQFIKTNDFDKQGIFVRFSQRSPKDSVMRMDKEKFYKHVEEYSIKIFNKQKNIEKLTDLFDKDSLIINAIIRAMTACSCIDLCCYTGLDAINLITFSTRIFQDFKLGTLIDEDNFKPKLILREYNHNIDFEYEFRTFVFKNEITAITQYNSLIYLPRIVNNKMEIQNGIISFWENKIHSNMKENGISSYVMDLGLLKQENEDDDDEKKSDDDNFEFVLIEINPFSTNAGAMLYNWKDPKDVKIMTSSPVTFRVLDKPFNEKPQKLTSELTDLFDKLCEKMQSM